jgi:hypothetical protein
MSCFRVFTAIYFCNRLRILWLSLELLQYSIPIMLKQNWYKTIHEHLFLYVEDLFRLRIDSYQLNMVVLHWVCVNFEPEMWNVSNLEYSMLLQH